MPSTLSKTATQLQRHYDTLITGDVHPVEHAVSKGDAREHGWRTMFRRFLPEKFGVKSGFIIDSFGQQSQQIDCIVYRKDFGIELYSVGHHTVIPVEAVFAAFEIKPTINKKHLNYAQKKMNSISQLTISNYLVIDEYSEVKSMRSAPANGGLILGLLADEFYSTPQNKWKTKSFKDHMKNPQTCLSLYMTVKDGCVDTLSTGRPAENYLFWGGDEAVLSQMIRIVEGIMFLEKARNMEECCLSGYKNGLDDAVKITI